MFSFFSDYSLPRCGDLCLLLAVNDPARSGQKKSAPFDYVALFQLMKLSDFGRDSDIILTLLMLNIQKKIKDYMVFKMQN